MGKLTYAGAPGPAPTPDLGNRPSRGQARYEWGDVDISARKRGERSLRESEQRYREIVETADEGVCCDDQVRQPVKLLAEVGAMTPYRSAEGG